jgi:hypothetical protein
MEDEQLKELMQSASSRYRTVRVAVSARLDRDAYRISLNRHLANPTAAAVLSDPHSPLTGMWEWSWRVWVDQPYRWRQEEFRPPGHLRGVSGGNEGQYWQYVPDANVRSVSEWHDPGMDPDSAQTWHFTSVVHPTVSELIDPSFLWSIPEGATHDPVLEFKARSERLGREAWNVRVVVRDWHTRSGLGETLLIADDYELIVDVATGVILRAACLLDGVEFAVTEAKTITFDEPMDRSLFEPPPGGP